MTSTITFDDIVNIGKRRVDDTKTVEIPALGGSVVIRQISGAEHDAAVALGHASGEFDGHAVARAQIIAALVEPALPEGEAESIIDNLPVKAFGQLQAIVIAHSGLGLTGVEELVKMFRDAERAIDADGDRSDDDSGSAVDQPEGVGSTDTDPDSEAASVPQVARPRAKAGRKAAGDAAEAPVKDGTVTA